MMCCVSGGQIYNEVISDLLKPDRSNLHIREDRKRGVFVEGLSEWVVRSPSEIYGLMERGAMQAKPSLMLRLTPSLTSAACPARAPRAAYLCSAPHILCPHTAWPLRAYRRPSGTIRCDTLRCHTL